MSKRSWSPRASFSVAAPHQNILLRPRSSIEAAPPGWVQTKPYTYSFVLRLTRTRTNIIPLIRALLNTKYYSLNQDIIKYLTPCSPLSSVCHVPCTCPPGCPPRPPLHRTAVRLRRSTRTASMRLVCMTGNLSNSFLESRLHMYLGGAAPDILE